MDAITVLKNELGIKNPANELETFRVTSDTYSSEYKFQQIYNGVRVLGRRIMVSTNNNDKGDFLHSSFLSSNIIEKANMQINKSISDAENIAKNYYSGEFEVNSDATEMIVYSLEDDYFSTPVYAYIVNVSGTKDNNEIYINEKIIVNASTGQIIKTFTDIDYAMNTGKNEKDNWVVFPVVVSDGYSNMIDTTDTPQIEVYKGDVTSGILWWQTPNIVKNKLGQAWDDGQAISAYVNMREIMTWWKDTFNRNSLNDEGMTVKVIVHQTVFNNDDMRKDNACWDHAKEKIYISDNEKKPFSIASAIDLLTHETTHAVWRYETGCYSNLNSTLKAINEGYADLFGCLKDQNWTIGEKLFDNESQYERNIKNNSAGENSQAYIDGVHYIAHVAYLMHESSGVENGLTWDELGQLWYKSIRKELAETSSFEDVRRCVKWAANELSLSEQKRNVINNAFEQTEIYAKQATLTGFVADYETEKNISDVSVSARPETAQLYLSPVEKFVATNSFGYFSIQLYKNWKYIITFDAADYIPLEIVKTIEKSAGDRLNVQLVKMGSGSITGTIYENETNKFPIDDVTLKIRSGWNKQSGNPISTTTTDANGQYSFDLGDNGAGYYTIEMIKDGYTTSTFNVTVSGETKWKDEYLDLEGSNAPVTTEESDTPTPNLVVTDILIDTAHFPDEVFRSYVLTSCDLDGDGILSKEEIGQVKILDATQMNIPSTWDSGLTRQLSSLKGIEYFYALEYLDCGFCKLTTLDISKNTALRYLDCYKNQLTKLDISNCKALTYLNCGYNQLTKLDISKCTDLKYLDCISNYLTELNVDKNTELEKIRCFGNQITNLNLSNCPKLTSGNVECGNNVNVIFSSTTNVAATLSAISSTNENISSIIVARLPKFQAIRTGKYSFDVSLDRTVSAKSTLTLKNLSENLSGVFFDENGKEITMPTTTHLDKVKISANFIAGSTYSPVIVAEANDNDNNDNSGGCNTGILSISALSLIIYAYSQRKMSI